MTSENLLFFIYMYDASWRKEFNLFMCIVNAFKKTCGLHCSLCAAASGSFFGGLKMKPGPLIASMPNSLQAF